MLRLGSFAFLLVLGCAEPQSALIVELRTDLGVPAEVSQAEVLVEPAGRRSVAPLSTSADPLEVRRVAEVTGLDRGEYAVTVTLLDAAGDAVIGRGVFVDVRTDTAVLVAIDRACDGVPCGGRESCLSGRCVPGACTSGLEEACPTDGCVAGSDCGVGSACSARRCVDAVCYAPSDATACMAGERCDPVMGCVPDTPSGGLTVDVEALDGTALPAGSESTLRLTATGAGSGATLPLSLVGPALFLTAAGPAATETVPFDATTASVDVPIRVSLDATAGSTVSVSSSATLTGDVTFTTRAPEARVVTVDGQDYRVPRGFELDAPLGLSATERAALVDRMDWATFPPTGASGRDFHLALDGPPAEIRVGHEGLGLMPLATSDGVNGPGRSFHQIAFAPDGRLYACSAGTDPDGLFRVAGAAFEVVRTFQNCNGIAFDPGGRLGRGSSRFYSNRNSTAIDLQSADGSFTELTNALDFVDWGHKLLIPVEGAFAGEMIVFTPGDSGPGDGHVLLADGFDPWAPRMFQSGLPDPRGGDVSTGGPMGDRLYLAMNTAGELRGYLPDASYVVLISGLRAPTAVAVHPESGAIWVGENGRGQVLRVRATYASR